MADVASALGCSSCRRLVLPAPTYVFCSEGHFICRSCLHKTKDGCPVVTDGRRCSLDSQAEKEGHWALEAEFPLYNALFESLEFKCKYHDLGCERILRSSDLSRHDRGCPFRPPVECKLPGSCGFFSVEEAKRHYTEFHNVKIFDEAAAVAILIDRPERPEDGRVRWMSSIFYHSDSDTNFCIWLEKEEGSRLILWVTTMDDKSLKRVDQKFRIRVNVRGKLGEKDDEEYYINANKASISAKEIKRSDCIVMGWDDVQEKLYPIGDTGVRGKPKLKYLICDIAIEEVPPQIEEVPPEDKASEEEVAAETPSELRVEVFSELRPDVRTDVATEVPPEMITKLPLQIEEVQPEDEASEEEVTTETPSELSIEVSSEFLPDIRSDAATEAPPEMMTEVPLQIEEVTREVSLGLNDDGSVKVAAETPSKLLLEVSSPVHPEVLADAGIEIPPEKITDVPPHIVKYGEFSREVSLDPNNDTSPKVAPETPSEIRVDVEVSSEVRPDVGVDATTEMPLETITEAALGIITQEYAETETEITTEAKADFPADIVTGEPGGNVTEIRVNTEELPVETRSAALQEIKTEVLPVISKEIGSISQEGTLELPTEGTGDVKAEVRAEAPVEDRKEIDTKVTTEVPCGIIMEVPENIKKEVTAVTLIVSKEEVVKHLGEEATYTSVDTTTEVNVGVVEDIPTEVAEFTQEVPVEVSEVTQEVPVGVGEVTEEVPLEIAKFTEEVPVEVAEVTQEVPLEIAEITIVVPVEVGEVTEEVPLEVTEVTQEVPLEIAEITIEVPVEVGEVTEEVPLEVAEVKKEAPAVEMVPKEVKAEAQTELKEVPVQTAQESTVMVGRVLPEVTNESAVGILAVVPVINAEVVCDEVRSDVPEDVTKEVPVNISEEISAVGNVGVHGDGIAEVISRETFPESQVVSSDACKQPAAVVILEATANASMDLEGGNVVGSIAEPPSATKAAPEENKTADLAVDTVEAKPASNAPVSVQVPTDVDIELETDVHTDVGKSVTEALVHLPLEVQTNVQAEIPADFSDNVSSNSSAQGFVENNSERRAKLDKVVCAEDSQGVSPETSLVTSDKCHAEISHESAPAVNPKMPLEGATIVPPLPTEVRQPVATEVKSSLVAVAQSLPTEVACCVDIDGGPAEATEDKPPIASEDRSPEATENDHELSTEDGTPEAAEVPAVVSRDIQPVLVTGMPPQILPHIATVSPPAEAKKGSPLAAPEFPSSIAAPARPMNALLPFEAPAEIPPGMMLVMSTDVRLEATAELPSGHSLQLSTDMPPHGCEELPKEIRSEVVVSAEVQVEPPTAAPIEGVPLGVTEVDSEDITTAASDSSEVVVSAEPPIEAPIEGVPVGVVEVAVEYIPVSPSESSTETSARADVEFLAEVYPGTSSDEFSDVPLDIPANILAEILEKSV